MTYLGSETEDAYAHEECDPLWLCGQNEFGVGEPHECGTDDSRVERKVGYRVCRRCTSTDGTDADVGSCATAYAEQCETYCEQALLLCDPLDRHIVLQKCAVATADEID